MAQNDSKDFLRRKSEPIILTPASPWDLFVGLKVHKFQVPLHLFSLPQGMIATKTHKELFFQHLEFDVFLSNSSYHSVWCHVSFIRVVQENLMFQNCYLEKQGKSNIVLKSKKSRETAWD